MSESDKSKKPLIIGVACCVVLLVSAVVIYKTMTPPTTDKMGEYRFFTDDDGETWFASDTKEQPPFDHNGKEAVCVFLYSCDGGNTKQVAYLLKFDPNAPPSRIPESPPGQMVKRKGDTKWVPMADWVIAGNLFPRNCPGQPGVIPVHIYPNGTEPLPKP